jgi:ubiquitin carboxyl-terminal hydrolase 8
MSYIIYQNIKKIDYDKYKDKGLTGLVNLGNTCFMNSCLQCLSHTYILRELFTDETFINSRFNTLNDDDLLKEWINLNNLMWSKNCTISCDRWLKCVQKKARQQNRYLFTGFNQNDCSEFLLFILENFHESLKRDVKMIINGTPKNNNDLLAIKCYNKIKELYEKEYSELINIFYGIEITRIKSLKNEEIIYIEKPEQFFILNLSIPNKSFTISDCFKLSIQKEILKDENAWFNDKTNEKEDVIIENSYWNLPNILIICLKRFNNYGKKINNELIIDNYKLNEDNNYSIIINLNKYVECNVDNKYIYEVYGFCIHTGGTLGGHYYSVIKTANNKWYIFNDRNVINIDNPVSQIPKLYSKSYCLFTKKI